jgi:lysophospholipase L1-like esterase
MNSVTTYRRYVAIGDSSTEGLEDRDANGRYIGFADRLAQHIADGQDEPLEYANLGIRGYKMREIRCTQLDAALAMKPDLLSIFGGVNDLLSPRCDFYALRAEFVIVFGEARRIGSTVITFTMPDPAAINPLAANLRDRVSKLNAIIRSEAERRGVLLVDFEDYPVAVDPRLWFDDRLHGNTLGHIRVAAALAWRLGVTDSDASWTQPVGEELVPRRPLERLSSDLEWARHYLAPWLGKGIRRVPSGLGIEPKRPVPTIVPRSVHRSSDLSA